MSTNHVSETAAEIDTDNLLAGRVMIATPKELYDNLVPLHWRDYCAHLLIPLNKCRRATLGAPWLCGHERHEYERCQFKDWLLRQEQASRDRAKAAKAEKAKTETTKQ